MTTEYHFEADYMDAMADLWQEEQDAMAEAEAEAAIARMLADAEEERQMDEEREEHERELLEEMRAELHDEDWIDREF